MTIFQEIKSKPTVYITISLIFITGAITFLLFAHNPHAQRNIVYATGGSYFLWSLLHHYHRGDLALSIIIEYLLFILFGILVLSSTLI
ncbi:hypothetical protein KBC75_01040 [Candidatus Shapirobacteria bacterium]|nr:hypothetical protein [Candidatus Shapirobacteria bacterium]